MITVPKEIVSFLTRHRYLGAFALRCLPDIKWYISVDPIGRMAIRLRRNRSLWIRSPLLAEAKMLGYLKRLIRPGDVFYDIGANLGLYSRFAAHFGAEEIFAFEPMSENIELLRHNVSFSSANRRRIHVMSFAVGHMDGIALLQVDDIMSGTAALDHVRHGEASYGRKLYGYSPLTETVRIGRLDTLIETESLKPPRVMKIDIEGAELLALEGAVRILDQFAPDLAIELHGSELAKKVIELLESHKYRSYAHVRVGHKMCYREVRSNQTHLLAPYDHIVASCDAELLREEIAPFKWLPKGT